MERPRVNLDSIAAVLDRVIEHPLAAVAAELLPQTHRAIRDARDNLPELASGLEAKVFDHVRREARELEREILGGVGRWVQDAIRTRRSPRRKVIAQKKAARGGKRA